MPSENLEKLTRTLFYEGKTIVFLRPGITLVMYSCEDLVRLMSSTADVLLAYLNFIPAEAIAAVYEPGPEEDEYVPGQWVLFDSEERRKLLNELRAGPTSEYDEGYSFTLSATSDGQAGNYGVTFEGANLSFLKGEQKATSMLRLDLPWNLLDTLPVASLVDHIERLAKLFPFCSGNAGMSFIHTISYVPEAREEIHKLLPRFLGFDSAHNSARLVMRGKTPPAHWLNLLDRNLMQKLGGQQVLQEKLEGCEVRNIGDGVLVRAARLPPLGDVNRGALDIGCLPMVARALKPICFDEGLFVGLADTESGEAWLNRFDSFESLNWNNV